ncbi:MAG: VWA domain-containing protein [Pseudomonadota bacterium]
MKKKTLFAAAALAGLFAAAPAAQADSNMLFVLDGSGSMWGKLDGVPKISTAKNVLGGLLGDLPSGSSAGLMVYGHRQKSSCEDVQLVAPIGSVTPRSAGRLISAVQPRGKTPIAYSLHLTRQAFQHLSPDEPKHVVLISDGIETCNGDPCAVAGALARSGINVKVHVVGFDISEGDRRQLQCIADAGNGRYFPADSTAGFKQAVAAAVKVAAAPTPQPEPEPEPEPEPATLFFDDFDGRELGPHWTVQNPDPDAFTIENGHLLAIASGPGTIGNGGIANIFRLNQPLPKGNWVATVQFRMPYHTGRETPFFGIYENKDNHTLGFANAWSYYEKVRGARLFLSAQKASKGKNTNFNKVVWGGAGGKAFSLADAPNPFVLRITKKGRSYTPAVRLQTGGETRWVEGEKMTALRQKGQLAFGIYQAEKVAGETPMYVDNVKIERLK